MSEAGHRAKAGYRSIVQIGPTCDEGRIVVEDFGLRCYFAFARIEARDFTMNDPDNPFALKAPESVFALREDHASRELPRGGTDER